LTSFLAAHLCFWVIPSVFRTWNAKTIDRLFVFRSASARFQPLYDSRIVHIDLNNTSLRELESAYVNRSHFAQGIRNLAKMGVSAQLYDFIFAAPLNEERDKALIAATAEAGNAYYGLAFELIREQPSTRKAAAGTSNFPYLDRTKWSVAVEGSPSQFYLGINPFPTFEGLAGAAKGLGSLSVEFDQDGVLRRVPLLVRYGGAFYPILPFRVICDYLGVSPDKITVKPGRHIVLQGAKKRVGDIAIPIDRHGNMIVNYIGPWERMDHYNFSDIFLASRDPEELEIWKEELEGKIAVVSDVSTGSTDIGPVPTDAKFPLSGLHANVMNNILTGDFLRELTGREMFLVEALLLLAMTGLALRVSSSLFFIGTMGLTVGYVLIAILGFLYGQVILNMIRPVLMLGFATISIAILRYINEEKEKMRSLRQRDFIRDTFGRYLSNEVVEELLGTPHGLEMTGESREITFLVSDLRGFTSLAGRLAPHDVLEFLNRYFERMIDIIAGYQGTVDELQGDGILAFFGAPLAAEDDAERAVACAIAMQNAMVKINEDQQRHGLPELAMGIGINTGTVIVGNIGSEKKAKYGAVGDAINTAFRIESATVGGQILISRNTYDRLRSAVRIRGTQEVSFKGIEHPLMLYDVAAIEGRYRLSVVERAQEELTELESPLPITCFSLIGKKASETALGGYIKSLSGSAAEVSIEGDVELYSNIKILLPPQNEIGVSAVYAKVVFKEQGHPTPSATRARLEFTTIPEDAREFLAKQC
jgi:adenylate cyclase